MLLFYQIFNIVLFGLLAGLSMWSLKAKGLENLKSAELPIKLPDYVYYGIVCFEIFMVYVLAGFVSALVCLGLSCI